MSKEKLQIFIMIFLAVLIIFIPFSAQAVHRTNCCVLRYRIDMDNIDICAPVGCDPEVAGCCTRQATFPFPIGAVVGPIESTVTQCWVGESQVPIAIATPHWGMVCMVNTINTITDWVFWFALALSIIVGVITGFMFMTAGGEPFKIEKAKGMLVWLIVGVAIAISAKLIVALITAIVI